MSRPCLRPLIIEPKKPLKTGAESRFRAKLDAHDNPTITLIIEPSRDLSRLTARFDDLGDRLPPRAGRRACRTPQRGVGRPFFRGGNNGKQGVSGEAHIVVPACRDLFELELLAL